MTEHEKLVKKFFNDRDKLTLVIYKYLKNYGLNVDIVDKDEISLDLDLKKEELENLINKMLLKLGFELKSKSTFLNIYSRKNYGKISLVLNYSKNDFITVKIGLAYSWEISTGSSKLADKIENDLLYLDLSNNYITPYYEYHDYLKNHGYRLINSNKDEPKKKNNVYYNGKYFVFADFDKIKIDVSKYPLPEIF